MIPVTAFFGRGRDKCTGEIRFEGPFAVVDCRECRDKADLKESECFSGLSSRLPPGFDRVLVLRNREDRCYSGEIMAALTSYSDILSMLEKATSLEATPFSRTGRIINRAKNSFEEDPCDFLQQAKRERKLLLSKGAKERADLIGDITERTELMIRRLERSLG